MNSICGTTQLFFVVADPVAQVKAPLVFNRVFEAHGVDAVAVPAQVAASRLAGFVEQSMALGNATGLLVSIPHKTTLADMLPHCDPVATMAGSVNAVRRNPKGHLEGALFDGAGFCGALQFHGVELRGRRVLLVGAGGAGLAIAAALVSTPLELLQVFDPVVARSEDLVRRLAGHASFPMEAAPGNAVEGFDLVINATPLGMRDSDALPFDPRPLRASAVVVDILMMPTVTPLLRACAAAGVRGLPGHEMLLQQLPCYLDFFDFPEIAQSLRKPGSSLMKQLRASIHGQPAV